VLQLVFQCLVILFYPSATIIYDQIYFLATLSLGRFVLEALEMRRGKSECRDKMEGQKIHPGGSIIRECNNLSFIA
jgi:hypothetical protein